MTNRELVAFLVVGTGFFGLWMGLVTGEFESWFLAWFSLVPVFATTVYAVDYIANRDFK